MRRGVVTLEFVEYIPDVLQDGVLYISIPLATAVHSCCCGCGGEVVTPLSPTDWKLLYDGVSVSLHPSIGNWSFVCQSHYWIRNNRVEWTKSWSQAQIEAGRDFDTWSKEHYYHQTPQIASPEIRAEPVPESWWQQLKRWIGKKIKNSR